MKEVKKGPSRKPIKSSILKRLWDDCLELESYIRYNAAHGIYKLDGEVTEANVQREVQHQSVF